jgi:shikimate dehydrogenase
LSRYELVVNTTSVGMMPDVDASPLPFPRDERAPSWVYDLVYRPRETRWLREAAERGARTIGGIEMLVYQGAEGFRLFTGRDAPVEVMRKAVSEGQG